MCVCVCVEGVVRDVPYYADGIMVASFPVFKHYNKSCVGPGTRLVHGCWLICPYK